MIPAFYEAYKFNCLGIYDKDVIIDRKVVYKALPNFMLFDQLNGILLVQPKSYEAEGEFVLYGRVVYQLPNDVFSNIAGVNSKQLESSLVRLGYIDTDGFVTVSFNGDLKYLNA